MMSRFSDKLRELGLTALQMSMPVEVPGGIKIWIQEREVEISIGEAADFVDGITTPVQFIRRFEL